MERDNSFRILSLIVIIPALACAVGVPRLEREGKKSFVKENKVTLAGVELHSLEESKVFFDTDGNPKTHEYVGFVRSGKLNKDSVGSAQSGEAWLNTMNMAVYKESGLIRE